jgi:membrane-bound ClpP family serine protease
MTITIVILLLLTAIGLILIEIFLIPGIGIPGVAGLGLMAGSLVMAYSIGNTEGHFALGFTIIASALLMFLAFRSKTWSRLSVTDEITSKVDAHTEELKIGDHGIAITRLNPIGNARFGETQFEVSSRGEFIEDHSSVEIITIEGNKIIVKPINV